MNLTEKAKQFRDGILVLSEWLGSGARTVEPLLAQERANVCLKCPMNIPVGKLASTVAMAVKRQVELKNKLHLRVNGEKSLMQCRGCGCVLKLKVHVPIENLGLDENELQRYPEWCWMKREWKANKP